MNFKLCEHVRRRCPHRLRNVKVRWQSRRGPSERAVEVHAGEPTETSLHWCGHHMICEWSSAAALRRSGCRPCGEECGRSESADEGWNQYLRISAALV